MAKTKKDAASGSEPTKRQRLKYDPSYCERIEKLGTEGKSAPEIRRTLGIPASTWRWCRRPSARGGLCIGAPRDHPSAR
jgi:hypothetical protein